MWRKGRTMFTEADLDMLRDTAEMLREMREFLPPGNLKLRVTLRAAAIEELRERVQPAAAPTRGYRFEQARRNYLGTTSPTKGVIENALAKE